MGYWTDIVVKVKSTKNERKFLSTLFKRGEETDENPHNNSGNSSVMFNLYSLSLGDDIDTKDVDYIYLLNHGWNDKKTGLPIYAFNKEGTEAVFYLTCKEHFSTGPLRLIQLLHKAIQRNGKDDMEMMVAWAGEQPYSEYELGYALINKTDRIHAYFPQEYISHDDRFDDEIVVHTMPIQIDVDKYNSLIPTIRKEFEKYFIYKDKNTDKRLISAINGTDYNGWFIEKMDKNTYSEPSTFDMLQTFLVGPCSNTMWSINYPDRLIPKLQLEGFGGLLFPFFKGEMKRYHLPQCHLYKAMLIVDEPVADVIDQRFYRLAEQRQYPLEAGYVKPDDFLIQFPSYMKTTPELEKSLAEMDPEVIEQLSNKNFKINPENVVGRVVYDNYYSREVIDDPDGKGVNLVKYQFHFAPEIEMLKQADEVGMYEDRPDGRVYILTTPIAQASDRVIVGPFFIAKSKEQE